MSAAAVLAAENPSLPEKETDNIIEVDPKELILITDKDDPLFDKRVNDPVDVRLAESMKKYGWRGEVQVVPSTRGLKVVAGRRRVKAAVAAELPLIRAEVMPVAPVETMRWMIAENELREEDDRFELARKAELFITTYIEAKRPTAADGEPNPLWEPSKALVAEARRHAQEATGRSQSRFSDLLALNKLDSRVKSAVRGGQLSEAAALAAGLHNMPKERQRIQLEKMLSKGATTRTSASAEKQNLTKPPSRKIVTAIAETAGIPKFAQEALRWATGVMTEDEAREVRWLQRAKEQLERGK